MSTPFVPVILSGGAGTRLWPVSREAHPKPFMRLHDGQSLLQKTFLRAVELPQVKEVLTITNRELFFKTESEYLPFCPPQVRTSFILEPVGRNTAPAVALAAVHLSRVYGDDVVMLVMPADHLINNGDAFRHAVEIAQSQAQKGLLVTFGIQPDRPETGFGYIQIDSTDTAAPKVLRFVEKPSFDIAQTYVASGHYLWNSGMFCFTAKQLLDQMRKYAPEIAELAENCVSTPVASAISVDATFTSSPVANSAATSTQFKSQATKSSSASANSTPTINSSAKQSALSKEKLTFVELNEAVFLQFPNISFDYALMEKSDSVGIVSCDIGWTDVGSWNAVSDLTKADDNGNSLVGQVYVHEAANCYVHSQDRVTSVVGVNDLIVVDTADALLVTHRDRAQDVRHIVQQLKKNNHDSYKFHRTVYRPWGSYTVLEEGKNFKMKRIEVKPNACLSLQMHYHRSEHWIVVSGTAKVTNGEEVFILNR